MQDTTPKDKSDSTIIPGNLDYAQLNLLLNGIPAFVSYIDAEFRYRFLNSNYEKITGGPVEQFIGKSVSEVLGEENFSRIEPYMREALAGKSRRFESWLSFPAGNSCYDISYLPDILNGRVRGIVVQAVDITVQKNAEAELVQKKEALQKMNTSLIRKATERTIEMSEKNTILDRQKIFIETLMDESSDLVAIYDTETRFISFNRKCEQVLGVQRQDVLGKKFLEVFPHAENTQSHADLLRAIKGEPVHNEEYISLQGLQMENFMIPLKSGNEVYGVIVIAHVKSELDSDERFRQVHADLELHKEELRLREERYQRMVVEIQDYAIILLDTEGVIRNWNKGAEKIKGYSAEEAIGQHFSMFYMKEDRIRRIPEQLIQEAKIKGRAAYEGWRLRKDGTQFWGNTVLTALHDKNRNIIGFTKITRDLTEKKIAEDKMLQFNERLQMQNRELEQFAYIASHDLQEPLRKIRTFNDRILKTEADNLSERGRDYFLRSINAAERMNTLIEELLAYSRVGRAGQEFMKVDLEKIVASVKQTYREKIEELGAVVKTKNLTEVYGIPFQLTQLMENLVSNSLKYHHPDRKPEIKISCEAVLVKHAEPESKPTSYHRIEVSDNGIGFEMAYAEKIFEMFQRLHGKTDYSGAGIGLAICKKIVQNHGGFFKVLSEPGEGSTFEVYLPIQPQ